MGRYFRLVGVEGDMVRGVFVVNLNGKGRVTNLMQTVWITAHDVTIYGDPEKSWGLIYGRDDLTGSVKLAPGDSTPVAEVARYYFERGNKGAHLQENLDEVLLVLVAVFEAAMNCEEVVEFHKKVKSGDERPWI